MIRCSAILIMCASGMVSLSMPCIADTHVHVLRVDTATPEGRPERDATVRYGLTEATSQILGVTDSRGIAEGLIDIKAIGGGVDTQPVKHLKLFITKNNRLVEQKDIEWETDKELERGFVVSLGPRKVNPTVSAAPYSPKCVAEVQNCGCSNSCDVCSMPMEANQCGFAPAVVYWCEVPAFQTFYWVAPGESVAVPVWCQP